MRSETAERAGHNDALYDRHGRRLPGDRSMNRLLHLSINHHVQALIVRVDLSAHPHLWPYFCVSRPRFPCTRPASDPPGQWQSLHHGHRTPLYALAWVCGASEYTKLIPERREVDLEQIIEDRWFEKNNFT